MTSFQAKISDQSSTADADDDDASKGTVSLSVASSEDLDWSVSAKTTVPDNPPTYHWVLVGELVGSEVGGHRCRCGTRLAERCSEGISLCSSVGVELG